MILHPLGIEPGPTDAQARMEATTPRSLLVAIRNSVQFIWMKTLNGSKFGFPWPI